MQAYTKGKPNQIKTNLRENEPRMNLLYLRFQSNNLLKFTVRSLMANSDRQTDE